MDSLQKKVAIVTGASSGIGRETVLHLIRDGYQVHAGARRLEAMRGLQDAGAYLHHVDLTSAADASTYLSTMPDMALMELWKMFPWPQPANKWKSICSLLRT